MDTAGCSPSACTAKLGEPATCSQNECRVLGSPDCATLLGNPLDDRSIVLGFLAPKTGPYAAYGAVMNATATMLVNAYNARVAGLPGSPRPLMVVSCDEMSAAGAAPHLVERIGVRGIFGGFDERRLQDVLAVAKPANVPVMSAFVANPTFASGAGTTVWSVKPNAAFAARYFSSALELMKGHLKEREPTKFAAFKIALIADGTLEAQEYADIVAPLVTAASAGGDAFSRFDYGNPYDEVPDYASVAASIASSQPNLILVARGFAFEALVRAIEDAWTGGPRPAYLINGAVPNLPVELVANKTLPSRVFVTVGRRTANVKTVYDEFVASFRAANRQTDPYAETELVSDAFYTLVFALHSASKGLSSDERVTPEQFQAALLRLNEPGQPVRASKEDLQNALQLLSAGADTDLVGASSTLEFVPDAGSPSTLAELFCVDRALQDGGVPANANVYRSMGITLDPSTGAATGSVDAGAVSCAAP